MDGLFGKLRWALGLVCALAAGCPVDVPAIDELGFACREQDDCAAGFRCVAQQCVQAGGAIDAGTAVLDAAVGDRSGAGDQASSDTMSQDVATADVTMTDAVMTDAAMTDVATTDVATPDAATPDVATPDAGGGTALERHVRGDGVFPEADTELSFALEPPVVAERAVLFVTVATDSFAPSQGHVSAQIVDDGARVRLRREASATGVRIQVAWTVLQVEGAMVQRGTDTVPNGAGLAVTLPSAVELARAFPMFTLHKSGSDFNSDDWLMAEIADATTLSFSRGATAADTFVDWQVIELPATSGASVQHGVTTLSSGETATTAALTSSVAPQSSFLMFSMRTDGPGGPQVAADQLLRGALTGPSQLSFSRGGTAFNMELAWYVVSWDAITAQRATAQLGAGVRDVDVNLLSAVDPDRAVGFCPSFQHRGETAWTEDDRVGNAWLTAVLSGDGARLHLSRAVADAQAEFSWTVIELD